MGKKALLLELFIRSILPPFYSFSLIEKICKVKLNKNPDDKDVHWILGNLYVHYKNFEKAKYNLEALIDLGVDSKHIRLLLSRVYYNLHEYSEVEQILNDGKILSSKDKENYYLGDSLLELNKFEPASIYLKNYVEKYADNYIPFVRLGYALFKIKKYGPSLEAYKKAEELNPTEKEIKNSIELCLDMLKKNQTLH